MGSRVGGVARNVAKRLVNSSRGRGILDDVLADADVADWAAHRLGIKASRTSAPINESAPDAAPQGFEDLMFLFTPTYAARGVSELLHDEAVYLYRLMRSTDQPRVAELGRYMGGTTYFLAAAGAHVVSLDNDALERGQQRRGMRTPKYREAIEQALGSSGLDDRVDLVTADALEYVVPRGGFDMIYLDLPLPTAKVAQVFDRWWPGLRPGGRMVLRDGRERRNPGVSAFATELLAGNEFQVEPDPPGRFVIVVSPSETEDAS